MSDLFGNYIVGFPTRRLILIGQGEVFPVSRINLYKSYILPKFKGRHYGAIAFTYLNAVDTHLWTAVKFLIALNLIF